VGEGHLHKRERVGRGTGNKTFQAFSATDDFQRLNKKAAKHNLIFGGQAESMKIIWYFQWRKKPPKITLFSGAFLWLPKILLLSAACPKTIKITYDR
jgi:hypothetical protein